jgi:hypothetical protein
MAAQPSSTPQIVQKPYNPTLPPVINLNSRATLIEQLFMDQQWKNYFDMLNGWVYFDIIRNLWVKAYVFYEALARDEVKKLVKADNLLKGKTKAQLGLSPFRGTKIRSNFLGIQVEIT